MKNNSVRRARDAALTAMVFAGLLATGTGAAADTQDGGAKAVGGSGLSDLFDQNSGLDGKQNNACGVSSSLSGSLLGGQSDAGCLTTDRSHRVDSPVTSGGAKAVGGAGFGGYQQNTAEQGKQNNACGNLDSALDFPDLTGACTAYDSSVNRGAVTHGGGAKATGGAESAYQQNTAQAGGQNNNCGNVNNSTVSGKAGAGCAAHDNSHSKNAVTHTGGARATGGTGDGVSLLNEQNSAQEGRQNNACGNTNNSGISGTARAGCAAHDNSHSKNAVTHTGGARATGGTGGPGAEVGVTQQNTAQEGRQNNACGNTNNGSVSGTARASCATRDDSNSRGTVTRTGGARATGGSSLGSLFQQNTAQDGRQNNACGNANALVLDPGRTNAQCSAVDESTEVNSDRHHHRG